MDNFEQFFKENRLRLDTEDLDNTFNERLSYSFRMHKRKRVLRQVYAAASIAAILVLGALLYVSKTQKTSTSQQTGIFYKVAPELANEENIFMTTIQKSLKEIKKEKVPVEYESMIQEFTEQLKIIDKQYNVYVQQLEEYGYSEEIIQQIIFNYQLKLSVLQMLQAEIKKINNLSKNEKHEYKEIKL